MSCSHFHPFGLMLVVFGVYVVGMSCSHFHLFALLPCSQKVVWHWMNKIVVYMWYAALPWTRRRPAFNGVFMYTVVSYPDQWDVLMVCSHCCQLSRPVRCSNGVFILLSAVQASEMFQWCVHTVVSYPGQWDVLMVCSHCCQLPRKITCSIISNGVFRLLSATRENYIVYNF